MQAIQDIRRQGFGERPCPIWERKLWLKLRDRNFRLGVEHCDEEFNLLREHGSGPGDDNRPGLTPDQAREQVRRMLFFLYDFSPEEPSFLTQFLNSQTILRWLEWQKPGARLEMTEKSSIEHRIYHVLQEHFTGVRLPERATGQDRRLYITLSRRRNEIRQSAQVVLAQIDWSNELVLDLVLRQNSIGNARTDLELNGRGRLNGASLVLTLPFLDYVVMRHYGELGEILQAAYVERLERFKTQIQKLAKETRSNVMLVRLKTDHTFRRQQYAVSDNKVEVIDVCETFPSGISRAAGGKNPAIQLFGNRLVNDQSHTELLVEFLLVSTAPKRLWLPSARNAFGDEFKTMLPSMEALKGWPETVTLQYAPKSRLNLKLFAFMGASRLDSRHETHRRHYKELLDRLKANIRVSESDGATDVLRTLENLFLGFQGAGSGRTWCAQSFLPVCAGFLAGETIWNESAARRGRPEDWSDVIEGLQTYFSSNKHLFLARGGEVLYLQLCNALRQPAETILRWVADSKVEIEQWEQDPEVLHRELQRELGELLGHCPKTVTDIAEFIDQGVESDTAKATDTENDEARFVDVGWCPADSWQEGYLFAVDLLRLCQSDLDVIERLELMRIACAMQILRSLAVQSARHSPPERRVAWPFYRLGISAPDEKRTPVKRISQHTVKAVEKLVYHAIRAVTIEVQDEESRDKALKEADTRYGGKLFISTSKRIGLLVPRRGPGARFTLNEQLLRFLVVTTVPSGGRLTYDRFKKLVEARHGLVFDASGFTRASQWSDGVEDLHLGSHCDTWLQDMLEAAGLLLHLSDSCALVENKAGTATETTGRTTI